MQLINVAQLRSRISAELPNFSDADPDVLSNYIITLLERDESIDELKASCVEKLEEFLLGGKPSGSCYYVYSVCP